MPRDSFEPDSFREVDVRPRARQVACMAAYLPQGPAAVVEHEAQDHLRLSHVERVLAVAGPALTNDELAGVTRHSGRLARVRVGPVFAIARADRSTRQIAADLATRSANAE